tara:strand:- start:16580 stop:18298 length:1719 start_codon:yes stop_codon:yes gene_type:complete
MEQKDIKEEGILEDISNIVNKSVERVEFELDQDNISVNSCKNSTGLNSKLYYVNTPWGTFFLKEILDTPRSMSGNIIPGAKTSDSFNKQLMLMLMFNQFGGLSPEVIYYNVEKKRLYQDYYEGGSFDDNVYALCKQVNNLKIQLQERCSDKPILVENESTRLDKDNLDYIGDKVARYIDGFFINDTIARIAFEKSNFDTTPFCKNISDFLTTLNYEEIETRLDNFFNQILPYQNKTKYAPIIKSLEDEVAPLKEKIGKVALAGWMGKLVSSDVSTEWCDYTMKDHELKKLLWFQAHHNDMIELRDELKEAMKQVNAPKNPSFFYKGKKRRFPIGLRYVSHDNHPGNCLLKKQLEVKMTEKPLDFHFSGHENALNYDARNINEIFDYFGEFRKFDPVNFKKLLGQYNGFDFNDFHKFGLATMPYTLAIFLSHPSMQDTPYERKVGYINHAIAQDLRIYLGENVNLNNPSFKEVKEVWFNKFKTAFIYFGMKNIGYIKSLMEKEEQGYYDGESSIEGKEMYLDKPNVIKRILNNIEQLTYEDREKDDLFGRTYRTLVQMPIQFLIDQDLETQIK